MRELFVPSMVFTSAAVLIKAKKLGVVKKLKPLLEQPGEHGYRMSYVLIAEVLNRVNETSD